MPAPRISDFVAGWASSPFAESDDRPWRVTQRAEELIGSAIPGLGSDYVLHGAVAVHRSATVEIGAILKGPVIIGARCFVAAGAYLRGGCYLAEECVIGPGCELKTGFMLSGSKLAHLNFVGDSILGAGVNVEAGAIIANYRNELEDKAIRIGLREGVIETGVDKFGALVGDGVRIGANAVIAPGALLAPATIVGRLELVDQARPISQRTDGRTLGPASSGEG